MGNRQSAETVNLMKRTNRHPHPVVFGHPGGGRLSIGDASSVDIYTPAEPGRLCVVDVKQQAYPCYAEEVIQYPLNDDVGGLADLDGLAGLLGRIDRRLRAGRDVHVVCAMGESRSVTVATNYVAAVLGVEFREALALVRYAYPQAGPNPGFYQVSQDNQAQISAEVQTLDVDEEWLHQLHVRHQAPTEVKLGDGASTEGQGTP